MKKSILRGLKCGNQQPLSVLNLEKWKAFPQRCRLSSWLFKSMGTRDRSERKARFLPNLLMNPPCKAVYQRGVSPRGAVPRALMALLSALRVKSEWPAGPSTWPGPGPPAFSLSAPVQRARRRGLIFPTGSPPRRVGGSVLQRLVLRGFLHEQWLSSVQLGRAIN